MISSITLDDHTGGPVTLHDTSATLNARAFRRSA